ncbi:MULTISPECIES: ribbon-helix-helix protein, CopG family [Floridanema]|uniref:Ribbon-helix-helix protein, CopG family n=2 Tax=Floridanema TaxID=3396149 RepID=A0ABV4YAQ8_9CYAN
MTNKQSQTKPMVGLRMEQEDLERIDQIAKVSGRTRSDVMLEAILNYWNIRQYETVMSDIHTLRTEMEARLTALEEKLQLKS